MSMIRKIRPVAVVQTRIWYRWFSWEHSPQGRTCRLSWEGSLGDPQVWFSPYQQADPLHYARSEKWRECDLKCCMSNFSFYQFLVWFHRPSLHWVNVESGTHINKRQWSLSRHVSQFSRHIGIVSWDHLFIHPLEYHYSHEKRIHTRSTCMMYNLP